MGISEHYTRALYRQSKDKKHKTRVLGLLMGKQIGTALEICNYIEIFDNIAEIDDEIVNQRITDYETMYKDLGVIGWYQSTKGSTDKPTKDDHALATDVMSKYCGQQHLLLHYNILSESSE